MDIAASPGYIFQHTATMLYRQSDQILQERLGIGMSQFKLLMVLHNHEHIQQRALADYLGQTEASISRQIKLLCEKGMLAIHINPKNRREHNAVLTAKGVRLAEAAGETLKEYYAPAWQQLSDKERSQLMNAMEKLHAYVCQEGKTFACDHPFSH